MGFTRNRRRYVGRFGIKMILNIDIDIVEVIQKDKINSFTPTLAMSFASDMIVMMLSTFCYYTGVSRLRPQGSPIK